MVQSIHNNNNAEQHQFFQWMLWAFDAIDSNIFLEWKLEDKQEGISFAIIALKPSFHIHLLFPPLPICLNIHASIFSFLTNSYLNHTMCGWSFLEFSKVILYLSLPLSIPVSTISHVEMFTSMSKCSYPSISILMFMSTSTTMSICMCLYISLHIFSWMCLF